MIFRTALRLTTACFALALLCAPSYATNENLPVCTGTNLFEKLQQEDPKLAAKVEKAAAEQPFGQGIYFKVEKEGVAPSVIMGTMHITDQRLRQFPETVTKALATADVLALEIAEIIQPQKMAAITMQNMGKIMYLNGPNLNDKLTPEQIDPIKALAEKAGIPWSAAAKMRPFFLMGILSVPACERQRTAAGQLVLDHALGDQAKANNIPVVGLETFAEQMDAVGSMDEAQKLKSLVDATKLADRIPDMFETMVQLYLKGETGLVWALMHASGPSGFTNGSERTDYSNFQRILIDKRNETMARGSKSLIDKGNAFIAVGALHLPGEKGVLNILAQQGYTISPL